MTVKQNKLENLEKKTRKPLKDNDQQVFPNIDLCKIQEPLLKCFFWGMKERVSCIEFYWWWEVDIFSESAISGTINEPRATETEWNCQRASLATTTDQFKPCIARKTARTGHETQTSDIAAR